MSVEEVLVVTEIGGWCGRQALSGLASDISQPHRFRPAPVCQQTLQLLLPSSFISNADAHEFLAMGIDTERAGRNAFSVGIIGCGDMGKMYAKRISEAGWKYDSLERPLSPES